MFSVRFRNVFLIQTQQCRRRLFFHEYIAGNGIKTSKVLLVSAVDPGHDGLDCSRGGGDAPDHGFRTSGLDDYVLFYIDELKQLVYTTLYTVYTRWYAPLSVLIPYIPISVSVSNSSCIVGTYYTDCVPFESKIQHFSRTYIIIIRVYAEVLRINVNKLALDVFRSGIRHTTFRCLTVHGTVQIIFNSYLIVSVQFCRRQFFTSRALRSPLKRMARSYRDAFQRTRYV